MDLVGWKGDLLWCACGSTRWKIDFDEDRRAYGIYMFILPCNISYQVVMAHVARVGYYKLGSTVHKTAWQKKQLVIKILLKDVTS